MNGQQGVLYLICLSIFTDISQFSLKPCNKGGVTRFQGKNLRLEKTHYSGPWLWQGHTLGAVTALSYPDLRLLLDQCGAIVLRVHRTHGSFQDTFLPLPCLGFKLCRCCWDDTDSVLLNQGTFIHAFFRVRSTLSCCRQVLSKQLLLTSFHHPAHSSLHQSHLTGDLTENNHQGT